MDRDEIYAERDNNALLFHSRKGNGIYNHGSGMIKNASNLNSLEKILSIEKSNVGYFYPELEASTVPLYFFDENIPPIQRLYNYYIIGNGMRVFIPKDRSMGEIVHIINIITTMGAENAGYVIFGDNIIPNFLSSDDKLTLSQFP